MAPTFLSMDHSLSLSTTMRRLVWWAMLLSASYVMPQVKAASPATATTCSLPPLLSRATAMPSAAESAVPACPGAVAVVLAFGAQHEPVQPTRSADCAELFLPSGEQFVHVGLMADVEQEAIGGGVEDVVQRERQFHHPEIRAQMPPIVGEHGDHSFADFRGQLIEFRRRELFDLLGGFYAFKYGCHIGAEFLIAGDAADPRPPSDFARCYIFARSLRQRGRNPFQALTQRAKRMG